GDHRYLHTDNRRQSLMCIRDSASIADPVTALVFGAAAPVSLSLVNGKPVVEDSRLLNVDEDAIARSTRAEAQRLARIAAQA
ncbi:hypothetical protein ACFWER_39815, partial [Streptomyces sp. NPDC060188]